MLIGAFLMGLLLAGFYIVWDGIFRYQAYGIVEATLIPVESPATGIIRNLYVTEGDHFRAGDLLAAIDNVSIEHELERTREELRLTEARLDAQVSELRLDTLKRSVLRKWNIHDNAAELFELAGRLRQHTAEAAWHEGQLARPIRLDQNSADSTEQLERAQYSLKGERELIELLTKAVDELTERQSAIPPQESVDFEQMRPARAYAFTTAIWGSHWFAARRRAR